MHMKCFGYHGIEVRENAGKLIIALGTREAPLAVWIGYPGI